MPDPLKKLIKMAIPFHDWKIRRKLISITLLLVLLPLLMVVSFSLDRFNDALKKAAEEDLDHLVRNIYALCKSHQEMMPNMAGPSLDQSESLRTLREAIRQIKVGETGYAYTIDSRGLLQVHPAKEGENILDSTDSAGFKYIRAMIKEALVLGDGQVETLSYPWMNPELGETAPRQKLTKYIYFKPWDWIISAGAYEEEIYHSLYKTERFIFSVVLVTLAIAVGLTIFLSRFLTKPILDLTRVTAQMSAGDLSQRVKIQGQDEIGILGDSFNSMAAKIEDYTSNLENLIEIRTKDLMDSREKYRALSHFLTSILESTTHYAIIAMEIDGTITEFNKGAEKLFGWKKEEVIQKENIAITHFSMSKEEIKNAFGGRVRSEDLSDQEMDRIQKNGRRFPAHSSLTAITEPSGGVRGFVEIVRNIAIRKSLEKELRETKEFLENIMESSVDGIVTTDLKGKITYMNRAMEEMLAYPRSELLGNHISIIYVRGIQEAWDIMNLLGADERIEHYEMDLKSKTGEVLTILTSASLLRDEEGKVIGTSGIFKNMTEQKRLEAKLKETQFYLIEASKMRALGELVAGVAHELNNPLMASQTIFHVIMNNLHEECPNRERLEIIGRCNNRIEKIVNHLREFSRQTESDFQELDINQPVENALMLTGQQLLNHNITINRRLTEGLPKIAGDSGQLEQVFLNLISNARDAMETVTGLKELTIHSYLTEEEEETMVVVSVKDTGEGIPEVILSKVLEPFFSTKPVGKGTGLGLSLCFGIVEAHGGRLKIKSQVGIGTEVKILLPVMKKT
ncbi:MAG: PAS domain S-box protein [Deltaproteobacteria bacterium]|nr:PAS domain S-box protein [Deltaproteobacteria bacterium]